MLKTVGLLIFTPKRYCTYNLLNYGVFGKKLEFWFRQTKDFIIDCGTSFSGPSCLNLKNRTMNLKKNGEKLDIY